MQSIVRSHDWYYEHWKNSTWLRLYSAAALLDYYFSAQQGYQLQLFVGFWNFFHFPIYEQGVDCQECTYI